MGGSGNQQYRGYVQYNHATDILEIGTSGLERLRIDSAGRLLINHTADTAAGGYASILQVCDTSYQGSSISLRRDGGTGGPALVFGKSRSSSKGGVDIVSSGDNLGSVSFYGADGTDVATPAAQIRCEVDGTPGSNDMPGRIIFATTGDGAASTTERMRIDSSGNFGIGVTPNVKLHVKLDTNKHLYFQGNIGEIGSVPGIQGVTDAGALTGLGLRGSDLRFATGSSERLRIDVSGRLLLGTTTASGYADRLLTVGDASTSSVTTEIRSSAQGQVAFSDGVAQNASSYRGPVGYNHGSDYMYFYTQASEQLRIDSSGRLLVNHTG